MAERHIHEDFISCDWCTKEEKGLRCSSSSDIERIVVGNIHSTKSDYSFGRLLALTGLEMDLCKSCQATFYEHIISFIKAHEVKDKVMYGD